MLLRNLLAGLFLTFGFWGHASPSLPISGPDLVSGEPVKVESGDLGTVVAFLSANCPCSRSHVPELKKLSAEYPQFRYVGVHSNRDEDLVPSREYFAGEKLGFPVIEDSEAKIADQFRALKTPHVFIILKSGRVAFQGGMTDSKDCAKADAKYLKDALDDLAAGKQVRNPEVRTLGCSISRRSKGGS